MAERQMIAGWGWPGNARKCHFFPEGSSMALCGRWGFFFGHRSVDNGKPSPDDCTVCRKALDKT